MEQITEGSGVHKDWYKRAREMTLENLPEFLKELTEKYEHDYGTICHAIASSAIATAWAVERTPQGGITGFQAGAIMWEFIQNWMTEYKNKPLRLVNYENMLFPQYEDNFKNTIAKGTADWLKKEAGKKLKDSDNMHPDVKAHLDKVAGGWIPFGYKVEDEQE